MENLGKTKENLGKTKEHLGKSLGTYENNRKPRKKFGKPRKN